MEEKKGFFRRLADGLSKTRNNIVSGIDSIFNGFSSIDDDFYEDLIPQIYKPSKKNVTIKDVLTIDNDLPFEVEPAKVPEVAQQPEPEVVEKTQEPQEAEDDERDVPRQPTIIDKWRTWLNSFMKEMSD